MTATKKQTTTKAPTESAKKSTGMAPSFALVTQYAQEMLGRRHNLPQLDAATRAGKTLGAGLPLGTSHYVSSNKRLVVVASYYAYYDTLTHERPDGAECGHTLYLDDGALWEVERQVKAQRPAIATSVPVRNTETGLFSRHCEYRLTCSHTGESLTFTTVWHPHSERDKPTKSQQEKRPRRQRVLSRVQPIARCDPGFRKAYGQRNDIESWFSWLKGRLLEHQRAASLDLDHQVVDVAYAGLITNALALRRYRLSR